MFHRGIIYTTQRFLKQLILYWYGYHIINNKNKIKIINSNQAQSGIFKQYTLICQVSTIIRQLSIISTVQYIDLMADVICSVEITD